MATIPFSDVLDWQPLPVDAQNIITKVRLVVAGNVAGNPTSPPLGAPMDTTELWATEPLAPWPITHIFEAPEHAIYGCERSFALPSGIDPFLSPLDPAIPDPTVNGFANPGSPSVVRDGDPETSATYTGGTMGGFMTYGSAGSEIPDCVGFRIQYSLQSSPGTSLLLAPPVGAIVALSVAAIDHPPAAVAGSAESTMQLPDAEDAAARYLVLPPHAAAAPENPGGLANFTGHVGVITLEAFPETLRVVSSMAITHFYPLVLNRPLLDDIAKAQVRLPAQLPRRVSVRGVVPPDRTHTISGWPGGDYTGVVAQHQYELGRTVIDFEQAGAPVGLPAEAMEAARERQGAIRAQVAAAGYALKMGERQ